MTSVMARMLISVVAAWSGAACAQTYPVKPVRVVPYSAGGPLDDVMRVVGHRLTGRHVNGVDAVAGKRARYFHRLVSGQPTLVPVRRGHSNRYRLPGRPDRADGVENFKRITQAILQTSPELVPPKIRQRRDEARDQASNRDTTAVQAD